MRKEKEEMHIGKKKLLTEVIKQKLQKSIHFDQITEIKTRVRDISYNFDS